jgi:heterodisulfide reductase subunit A
MSVHQPELEERAEQLGRATHYDTLVIGAGIAGLQAALDLADQGREVIIVERQPSIGGAMIGLSKVFPTLDCASCITTPKMAAAAHHRDIAIHTYSEVEDLTPTENGYAAIVRRKARSVDEVACIGCRQCEYACPVEVPDEFQGEFTSRKAVYVPFTNAIPQVALLDKQSCTLCGACAKVCPKDCIVYDQQDQLIPIEVEHVVLATGWELTSASRKAQYGGDRIANVISPLQMERLLAPHGPYGRVLRPADGKDPASVAWVQCAGSRDKTLGVPWCSRVCCMYAIKQAMLLSGALPFADLTIYYMDIRAFGKGYEEFYRSAKAMGIEFVKAKVGRLEEAADRSVNVHIERIDERGQAETRTHDMVVLSLGMAPVPDTRELLPLDLGEDGFVDVPHPKDAPCRTSLPHVTAAGTVTGPMDIVDTIAEASAAAMEICREGDRG